MIAFKIPRPALPGGFVSALAWVGDLAKRAALALWRSFWAVWGNPMAYPSIGVIAVGMFVVGYDTGRDRRMATITDLRAALAKSKAETEVARQREQAAQKQAQDARDEVKRVSEALEGFRLPAPPAKPTVARPVPKVVKPSPDTSWKPF